MSKEPKNMDDVKRLLETLSGSMPAEMVEIFKHYYGLLPNQGESIPVTIGGEQVLIDKSISDFIYECNASGFKTLSCCSGVRSEHEGAKYPPSEGFISFEYDETTHAVLKEAAQALNLIVNTGTVYFKPAVIIRLKGKTDKVLLKKWRALQNYLLGSWR